MSNVRMDFNQSNFDSEVKQSPIPVVVEYWASWSGPNKLMAPCLDSLAEEYGDQVKFGRVNIDIEGELAKNEGIRSVPTVTIFKDGRKATQVQGPQSMAQLRSLIANNI